MSKATPLGVVGKGALLDTVALNMHNRTCRSVLGLLVGNSKGCNKPASSHYFGFNLNFNDVPYGNANALHIHKTFDYFMAFSGDFEIRAGNDARSAVTLKKHDMIIVPEFYKRYFKCVATKHQMHYCEEMKEHSDGQCALMLAGIVGQPWVQWSKETVCAAQENRILCNNVGTLYDAGAEPPPDELLEKESDCSQDELEACVLRASDRPCATRAFGDGDMRFEYIDVFPGKAAGWRADQERNYCVFVLEGPEVIVHGRGAESVKSSLMIGETLVVPKGQDWGLSLPEEEKRTALVYMISGNITEASYPREVLEHFERAAKKPRTEKAGA